MAFDQTLLGFPVEILKIQSTLKNLWSTEGQTKARASLLNLVVMCHDTGALESTTRLIEAFVREHACRAFLVGDCEKAGEARMSAWIQAHCHVTKAGARQICSEQITILGEGISEQGIANAVLANLDYDLPLTLWWQGCLPAAPESTLWNIVDRLIFDSREWKDVAEQLHSLHAIKAKNTRRLALADLNWTRLLPFRMAIAQCFDFAESLAALAKIESLRIIHDPQSLSTARMLACWMAAQLGWKPSEWTDSRVLFHRADAETEAVFQSASTGAASGIGEVLIRAAGLTITIKPSPGAKLLTGTVIGSDFSREMNFSAAPAQLLELLSCEMNPNARHRVYQRALALYQAML
jgi:glucose-6-phosphate dehydrogenase assembly protein OpcA